MPGRVLITIYVIEIHLIIGWVLGPPFTFGWCESTNQNDTRSVQEGFENELIRRERITNPQCPFMFLWNWSIWHRTNESQLTYLCFLQERIQEIWSHNVSIWIPCGSWGTTPILGQSSSIFRETHRAYFQWYCSLPFGLAGAKRGISSLPIFLRLSDRLGNHRQKAYVRGWSPLRLCSSSQIPLCLWIHGRE